MFSQVVVSGLVTLHVLIRLNLVWGQTPTHFAIATTNFSTASHLYIPATIVGPGGGGGYCISALACFTPSPSNAVWLYPDGSMIPIRSGINAVSNTIHSIRQPTAITLHRGDGYIPPGGRYCCGSPTNATQRLCITLKSCPLLSLTNGMVTYTDPVIDLYSMSTFTAIHSCDDGYLLAGESIRICNIRFGRFGSGTWEGTGRTCNLVQCGPPPSVPNGFPGTPTRTTLGGTVSYNCNDGYSLQGSPNVTCLVTSGWSTRPTCIATCPDIPLINGVVTYSSGPPRLQGTVATYRCDIEYEPSGGPERVCQDDRTWSGGDISCIVITAEVIASTDAPAFGRNFSLMCTVTGTDLDSVNPTINYQWFKTTNNMIMPLGTNLPTLNFDPLNLSDVGQYNCEITISSNQLPRVLTAASGVYELDITDIFIQLILSGIHNCREYLQDNANSIVADVTTQLALAVQERCGCGFSRDHFSKSFVKCFSESPHQVTFRAQLNKTIQSSAVDLVSYIKQWMTNTGGDFVVQGSLLHLNTTCPLVISDLFAATECPRSQPMTVTTTVLPSPQPDNKGTIIVVGVLGLALILAITVTIISCFVVRIRVKRKDVKLSVPLSVDNRHSTPSQVYETVDDNYDEIRGTSSGYDYSQNQAYATKKFNDAIADTNMSCTPTEDSM